MGNDSEVTEPTLSPLVGQISMFDPDTVLVLRSFSILFASCSCLETLEITTLHYSLHKLCLIRLWNFFLCLKLFESQNTTATGNTTAKSALDEIFLQTKACQAISGIFCWLAILITLHQVSLIVVDLHYA